MHNRTNIINISHIPDLPSNEFPISFPGDDTYSPSYEPISQIHFHDSIEIGYCFEGGGVFFIDGKLMPFSAKDVSIIFKNQLHIAQSDSNNISKWKFISFMPELLIDELSLSEINNISSVLFYKNNFPNILSYSIYPNISQLVLNIMEELYLKKPEFKSYVKALVWELFIEVKRISINGLDNSLCQQNTIQVIAPALEYIANNYMNHIEVVTLANLCHTSERNLRRLFIKSLKLSPQQYIIEFRIKMSISLLRTTDYPILFISSSVGFSSLSSFNRQFKALMGTCPKNMRTQSMQIIYIH